MMTTKKKVDRKADGASPVKRKMKVKLESKSNMDFDSSALEGVLNIEAYWVVVETIEEAKIVCDAFIEKNELGGGNWTGGDIVDENDKLIGSVSYNGKFWKVMKVLPN